jgi:toxin ParE1/3/4
VSGAGAERRFRIHDEATLELRRAAAWYDERRAGLGDDLVLAFDAATAKIVEAPERWPRFVGVRRYVLKRFPYNIIFRFDDHQVEIVAFAHHRRRPDYWASRLGPGPRR